jgi:thiamine pyrophosphokinase
VAQQDPEFAELVKSVPLNAVHGDLDSLSDAAKAWAESFGAKVERDPAEDTTDFTKCINYISKDYKVNRPAQGAPDILAFGGLGGRVDQAISVLHHLYVSPSVYPKGQIYLTTTSSISFLLKTGTHRIIVRDPEAPDVLGVHIGILPLNGSSKITTKGLRWDVEDWETSMTTKMSTSNMVREEEVEVKTEGDVLFTIDFPNKEEVDV